MQETKSLHVLVAEKHGDRAASLQAMLREQGYEDAAVRRVEDYKRLVARGALKTAQRVKNDQWQLPM